jgi:uncharacterized protein
MITIPIPKHGLVLIAAVWSFWWLAAGPNPLTVVAAHWPISVTMIFGSLVAGSTSEGGGAVAFPVLTKLLHVAPTDAKVFSLAIQSVGMTSATIAIILSRIAVEWRVICWATLGGIPGVVVGSALLAPLFPADAIKLAFTVMVSTFAITLYLVNRGNRATHEWTPEFGAREKSLLLATGFLGGILSGLVGSGIDIVCFSLMVLLFRLSVKVATPTSVVLMALNAIVGFCLHYFFIGGFTETIRNYWLAAVPVVVIGGTSRRPDLCPLEQQDHRQCPDRPHSDRTGQYLMDHPVERAFGPDRRFGVYLFLVSLLYYAPLQVVYAGAAPGRPPVKIKETVRAGGYHQCSVNHFQMQRGKTMRAFLQHLLLLFAVLTLTACVTKIPSESLPQNIRIGGIYYTQFALQYEKERYRTTNYRRGFLLPINTEVKLIDIDSRKIKVQIPSIGKELLIENVEKHTNENTIQAFDKLFAPVKVNLSRFNALEQEQIKTGTVVPGMRKRAVIAAIGYPPAVGTQSLDKDQWKYWNSRFNTFIVHFENGRVSEIQE